MRACRIVVFFAGVFFGISTCAQAQLGSAKAEPSKLPAPGWVQMIDQGEADVALKGLKTPRGVKLEVVGESEYFAKAVDMAFDDGGWLYLLDATGRLVVLQPRQGEGDFADASVLMNDLTGAAGLLLHDGWFYWTSEERILRRRQQDATLLKELQTAADARKVPATSVTADGKWIEQRLMQGMSAVSPSQAGNIAIGPDGWLYVVTGSGDQRAESWDGSRAVVLRTGAIFRMRPDGSQIHEVARGLAQPAGGLVFDDLGNVFCIGDIVPGEDVGAARLIHALAGGDYGWRHVGSSDVGEFDERVLRTPDPMRSAVRGERPGTFPPLLNGCAATSAVMYYGSAFPPSFQGLLIAANPEGREVYAVSLNRSGLTFEVVSRFTLLGSDDPRFRPASLTIGPDGAIYVADGRGRLFRLSFCGDAQTNGLPLAPRDSWARVEKASPEELWALLDSADQVVMHRAAQRLATDSRERLMGLAKDANRQAATRAAAHSALAHQPDKPTRDLILNLLADDNSDLACLAAGHLGDTPPAEREELLAAAEAVKAVLSRTRDPKIERATRLALGRLAAAGMEDAAEWGFESMSVTHRLRTSRYVFDAHVRALEMVPGAAKELMLGNLDVAINMPEVEPQERERLKEFVTLTAEAMRSRELAEFLDRLLAAEDDLFANMQAALQVRLLRCYLNVLVDPPINVDAVARWLEKQPGISADVEIAALEIVLLVGVSEAEIAERASVRVLGTLENVIAIARRIISGHLDKGLLPRVKESLQAHAEKDNTGRAASMLIELAKPMR